MIVTIGGIKGGSGKSTIATNLACIAATMGDEILLIDADDQESASDFSCLRKRDHSQNPQYTCIKLNGEAVMSEGRRLSDNYDHVIIDTGGRDTESQRAALAISDKLIIPFVPRSFDVWTIERVAKLVREMRLANPALKALVLLNRCDPEGQGDENTDAEDLLKGEEAEGLEFLNASIGQRKAFGHAASEGLAVTEIRDKRQNEKANQEILTLYKSCFNVKTTLKAVG